MSPVSRANNSDHSELTAKGFAALLNSAVDSIVIIDKMGCILNFNQAAQELFGYQLNEVLHHNVKMLMPKPYRDKHDGYMQRYQETGEAKIIGIGRETRAIKKNGEEFPVFLSIGEYAENEEHFYIGIIRNLTQQHEAEEISRNLKTQLAHVERISTMEEMASGLAHELNQPLSAVNSYVQAAKKRLESSPLDPVKIAGLLSKVEQQTVRAGNVMERIRSVAKMNDLALTCAQLNEVVKQAVELIRPEAESRGIALKTHYMSSDCEIKIDTAQIQQVILNLARNAFDATEESGVKRGVVWIRTLIADDDSVEVVVQDEGGGIPEEVRTRLFHPFVSSKNRGIGLGLTISQSIAYAHGGTLQAEDLKYGTVFRLSIPLALKPHD